MVVSQLVQHGGEPVFEIAGREDSLQQGRSQRASPTRPGLSRNRAPHSKMFGTRLPKTAKWASSIRTAFPVLREDGEASLHAEKVASIVQSSREKFRRKQSPAVAKAPSAKT